jgi:hypothetical protein
MCAGRLGPSDARGFLVETGERRPDRAMGTSGTNRQRQDRTARMLAARLESLAGVCERSPAAVRRADVPVLAVEAATRRAVDLELISAEDACAIWAAVAARHPTVPWCREPDLGA